MLWLGVETSCDETGVALVEEEEGRTRVIGALLASQISRHRPFGGIVPELAVREHARNLPVLTARLFEETRFAPRELGGIAVTEGPGLASSLLIGNAYARAMGAAIDLPVFGINHLEGHLFSPFLEGEEPISFPFLGLVVSGGHSLLASVEGWNRYRILSSTSDDAAGEALDKIARLLGLPYPGGPEIEKLASRGNPKAFPFPRGFPEKGDLRLSFSGLKTAVRYFLARHADECRDPAFLADVAASLQESVVRTLCEKTLWAAASGGFRILAASGGVLANRRLREALEAGCRELGLLLRIAPPALCTDNAVMIASAAALKSAAGLPASLREDIDPGLPLAI
ncbi:tRNA N6-adenosine threonylcarbamoyltransferase [Methylacidimicrobium cyclopophantes]|uniref:tRNA N6-adenosine threonylcarbamoyltransferase n=1 Tax=Methylacidimicrobium cyclopophantes TaxID=1041766 RepID=A0A5E6MG40_9BACT|nr:tRNA (adenosine(37)-N6)-threonylcarbamoyltransferase complex transferase subunit TsaD [Methylacidimicrobium cyclopophantes]VVM07972.1 tRNA N6-adenosine threonylcarbamoyltransferase [Methylacidimicrobium cyclopophantes]